LITTTKIIYQYLGAFAKLWRATVSFMSVCLYCVCGWYEYF